MSDTFQIESRDVPSGFKRRDGSDITLADLDTLDLPDVFYTAAKLGMEVGKAHEGRQYLMLAALATDLAEATQLVIRESVIAFVDLRERDAKLHEAQDLVSMFSKSVRHLQNWIHSADMEDDPELQWQQLGRDVCEWVVAYATKLRAENRLLQAKLAAAPFIYSQSAVPRGTHGPE